MPALRAEAAEQYLAAAERYLAAAIGISTGLGAAADDPALVGLETAQHSALYSMGQLDDADAVYRSIDRRCADPMALADATCLQVSSLTSRGRSADAVALGFTLLDRLGFAAPGEQIRAEVEQRLDDVYEWIERVTVDVDMRRPEASDARAVAVARLIRRMAPAALFSDQMMLAWLVIEAQQLWVRYGPCAPLVPTLASFCLSTSWIRQDYVVGVRITQHVLAVGEARGYELHTAKARYLYAATAAHWVEPVENDIQYSRAAREILLRGGDLESACLAYFSEIYALLDYGPTLDDLASGIESLGAFAARAGNNRSIAFQPVFRQFVRAMRGQTAQPGSLNEGSFDEDAHAKLDPRIAVQVHTWRALAAAIFDDPAQLVSHAKVSYALAPLVKSFYAYTWANLAQALALAHKARSAPPPDRPDLLAELNACRDWMAQRAQDAPENFRHLLSLIEAERAWVLDDFRVAAAAFDASLREVELRQRPWHRALIAERAGLFELAHGKERAGYALLTEARQSYEDWGALGKIQQLDRMYPFLRRAVAATDSGPPIDRTDSGSSVRTDDIDMLAILRASQALSSETGLERLYTSVVEQTRALTGATTGCLILLDEDTAEWVISPQRLRTRHATASLRRHRPRPGAPFRFPLRRTHPGAAARRGRHPRRPLRPRSLLHRRRTLLPARGAHHQAGHHVRDPAAGEPAQQGRLLRRSPRCGQAHRRPARRLPGQRTAVPPP